MTAPKNRSAAQAWKALEDRFEDDDEADRIAALSPEALEGEVAALGVDVEVQREKGRAFAAEVERAIAAKTVDPAGPPSGRAEPAGEGEAKGAVRAVPQQTPEPPREGKAVPLRRFSPLWLLAAAIVLVSLGVAALAGVFDRHEPEPGPRPDQPYQPPVAPPAPPESRPAAAVRLRHEAEHACALKDWKTCIAKLDDAEQRDSSLASDPDLQKLRANAMLELERKSKQDGG